MNSLRMHHALAALVFVSAAPPSPSYAQTGSVHYAVKDSIPIGRVFGDYYTFDSIRHRLYGAGSYAVDVDTKRVVQLGEGVEGGGFIIAPELGHGLVRNGAMFDLGSGTKIKNVPIDGDEVLYEPMTHRGFVLSDSITVIDMRSGDIVGKLGADGPMVAGAVDGKGMIYVALGGRNGSVLVIDAKTLRVKRSFPIEAAFVKSLAIDPVHHRLFASGEDEVAVIDAANGRAVTTIPVPGPSHESEFDPVTGLLFEPGGPDRGLTIVHEETPEKFVVVQTVSDSRVTSLRIVIDHDTHHVYMPHRMADSTLAFLVLVDEH
jgi:DNA-binding beta-propeller fold protein YncE